MPLAPAVPGEGTAGIQEAGASDGRGQLGRLLRTSHVFAALVREILEEGVWRAVSSPPLTPVQLQLLRLTTAAAGRRVGEAAVFLGVSPPATTKNVDKLEGLGLVSRGAAPADRRAKTLAASPAGACLVAECRAREAERMAPVLVAIEGSELAELTRLLERFCLRLLAAAGDRGRPCLRCAGHYAADCPLRGLVGDCPWLGVAGPVAPPAALGPEGPEEVA